MKIGDTYRFKPSCFTETGDGTLAHLPGCPVDVTGKVVYINEPHRYFTVEYIVWGNTLRESFKF